MNIRHIVHPEIGRLPPRRQGRLHHRLRVQAQRKLLDAALVHLEGLPLVAAEGFQPVRFPGDGGKEPVFPLKHRRRPGQPPFRQHRRKHRVAAGVGVGAPLPVGQHSHPRLPQRQVGRNPQVNRLLGLRRRQPQRPRRAHRAGNRAVGNMVKADVLETEGVSEPAEGLVGHRRSHQQTPPAGAGHFRPGQGRRDAVAGMPRLQGGIAVVEIQIADHHPVGEGRQIGAAGQPAADDGNRTPADHLAGQIPRHLGRLRRIAPDGAADAVNNHPLQQMNRIPRQIPVVQVGRIAGHIPGDCAAHPGIPPVSAAASDWIELID